MNRVVFGGDAAAHPCLHEMARRFLSCRPQVRRLRLYVERSDRTFGDDIRFTVMVDLDDHTVTQQLYLAAGQELNYAAEEVFLALSSHVLAQPNVVVVPHSPEDAELAAAATAALNEILNEANGVDEDMQEEESTGNDLPFANPPNRRWTFGSNDGAIAERVLRQRQMHIGAEAARLAGIDDTALGPDPTMDPSGYIEWMRGSHDRERQLHLGPAAQHFLRGNKQSPKPSTPPPEPLKPRKINRALLKENNS